MSGKPHDDGIFTDTAFRQMILRLNFFDCFRCFRRALELYIAGRVIIRDTIFVHKRCESIFCHVNNNQIRLPFIILLVVGTKAGYRKIHISCRCLNRHRIPDLYIQRKLGV